MVEAVRIEIRAYTASFRVPHLQGYQLTLDVPPPSTIFGLLSAARGEWVIPGRQVPWIAYRFIHEGRSEDLEKIIIFEHGKPKYKKGELVRNVIKREFLLNPRLILYLPEDPWAETFRRPRFPLSLGRSQDVAYVTEIRRGVELEPTNEGEIEGVLLPYELIFQASIPAMVYNLPVAFSDPYRREILTMKIFGIVRGPQSVKDFNLLVRDSQTGDVFPIYTHEWLLSRD